MNRSSTTPALQLRLLPEAERADALTSGRESQWFERKGARTQPRAIADAMIGMANADGGLIAVGIDDDGRLDGVSPAQENALRNAAQRFTAPPVRHAFEITEVQRPNGARASVALIEVQASEYVHRNVQDEVYLRVGDENRKLRLIEAQELEYDKGQSSYDGRLAHGASAVDFDAGIVDRYARRIRSNVPVEDILVARGLAVRDGDTIGPTVAGLLLLGSNPQRVFPEAFVRVLEYTTNEREVGSRANIRSDKRFEGALPLQIEATRRELRRRLPRAIRLGRRGRFERTPLLPEDAWLEAVVNAVVHRSYSMAGDHIRVEVFPDRMEVRSPGRLPGLVRVENIRSTRFARNPRIARAIGDFGYGCELGEGVDRMFEEMVRVGLPEPRYEQRSDSVSVTLRFASRMGHMLAELPPPLGRLYEYAERSGWVTTTAAMAYLGQSRPTALRYLRELEARGLLRHEASSPKDPTGRWVVGED